jgi:hypothetical protein
MPSSPTNRVIVWIDPEVEFIAHDDGPVSTVIRRVDVEVGNTIIGVGRMGVASDGEIIGVSDRLIAAFTELRNAAARRLSERGGPPRTDGNVCQSPVCPRQAMTHFAGDRGCSTAIARPPTLLRAASAERPAAPLEHDEELHSGHPESKAYIAGCPACDAAFFANPDWRFQRVDPVPGTASTPPPLGFGVPGSGVGF